MGAQTEHHEDGQELTGSSPQHAPAESAISPADTREGIDIFQIPAADALTAVTTYLAELARITGDIPATPYPQQPPNPEDRAQGADIIAEKQNSAVSITELHCVDAKDASKEMTPEAVIQHDASVKRFYSKKAPPISLEEYLGRLHKYCPMSTAVYLAASLYITRMVSAERALSVTPRNVHRLVLAALRVAMKALEDLSYPHARFARVGGVAERELTRLEITFCFLTDFDLRVDAHVLLNQAKLLQDTPHLGVTYLASPPVGHRNDTASPSTIAQTISSELSEIPS